MTITAKCKYYMEKYKLIILMVLFVGLIFYWYSYRPVQIRKNCYNSIFHKKINPYNPITDTDAEIRSSLNFGYNNCLRSSGLNY
jgi:hypothetical protein